MAIKKNLKDREGEFLRIISERDTSDGLLVNVIDEVRV